MAVIVSSPVLPPLTFFGDSSSKDKQFMVAGGFAVKGSRIAEIEDHIAMLRREGGISSEFHWSAYRGGRKREAYERLVDYAFQLIKERKAHFHVIVPEFRSFDHKVTDGQNKDTSVNLMYFQLLLHRVARFYGKFCEIHVRLDAGNDSIDICKKREALCIAAYKKYQTKPGCVKTIEAVCSEKAGLVQMADVLVGAIAAKRNKVVHTSPKGALADYVLDQSPRQSWDNQTPYNARFLTVWNFKI